MTKTDPTQFFQTPQGAAVLKHGLLKRYLPVFATKASLNSRGKMVAFLDGYAGPGTYGDGTPGSPALALGISERLRGFNPSRNLRCLLVEEHQGLAGELADLVSGYVGEHRVVCGRIEDHLDELVAEVEEVPLLAFLDPFGLGMPLERLVDAFLDRPNIVGRATELLLNFNLTGLPRFGGLLRSTAWNPARDAQLARIDAVMGGPEWRDLWDPSDSAASSDAVADLFCQQASNLSARGGWGYFRTGVGNKWNGRPKYELILLTSHRDGAWFFNESLSGATEEFYDFCHPHQQTTDAPKLRKEEMIIEIMQNILQLFNDKGAFIVKNEISRLYGETLGFARSTHVRSAIKRLHAEGKTSHTGVGQRVENFYIERRNSS